jgi:UDP-N-acetylglucosamine 2-epimerase (non-hydrolysing)
MPEEVNRVLTDRLSDLLLTPSRDAAENLLAEGIEAGRIVFAGNVMIDTLFTHIGRARKLNAARALGLDTGEYVLVTLHRPSTVDARETLISALEGLARINERTRVVLPLHPRSRRNAEAFDLSNLLADLLVLPPLGYLEMLSLTDAAAVVLTDSGGLQEETTALGIPCITLREQTDRPITLTNGTNQMATWPLTADGIFKSFLGAAGRGRAEPGSKCPEGWDGRASERIVSALVR